MWKTHNWGKFLSALSYYSSTQWVIWWCPSSQRVPEKGIIMKTCSCEVFVSTWLGICKNRSAVHHSLLTWHFIFNYSYLRIQTFPGINDQSKGCWSILSLYHAVSLFDHHCRQNTWEVSTDFYTAKCLRNFDLPTNRENIKYLKYLTNVVPKRDKHHYEIKCVLLN